MGHELTRHRHLLGIGRIGECDRAIADDDVANVASDRQYRATDVLAENGGQLERKSFCRLPERIFQSIGFTLVATAAISTSSAPMTGSATFSS
ncbi:hypothetical protein [Sphingomonas sp. Mn802worker]|uniref:hypothetical protein n=1 Tax=Sphingomonas sp. Mn802worker TaxID=629773 RepID=UPI0003A6AB7A|nr:hypothetical protein [Sphingomonas sp. Mn802worker]